jgi:DNA-binding MarR family transcriptional regulator
MVTRAMTQLYDDTLRPSGLRVTQFSILGQIARLGAANVTQLTHVLEIDQTTLTRSLKLLEHAALIERVAQADARVKALQLTAKGKQALKAAYPLWERAQQRVLRHVGAEAWADIQRLLFNLVPGAESGTTEVRR